MTKAMTPSEHQFSQLFGLVAANPAVAVPFHHELARGILAISLMFHEFDADCMDMADEIKRQLVEWRQETALSTHDIFEAAA